MLVFNRKLAVHFYTLSLFSLTKIFNDTYVKDTARKIYLKFVTFKYAKKRIKNKSAIVFSSASPTGPRMLIQIHCCS